MKELEDIFGPVIYSYTRAQALEDGVLVDVSDLAKEAGFKLPVAVTAGVWAELKAVDGEHTGHLWDVLCMCYFTIRAGKSDGDKVVFWVRIGDEVHSMWALCGPGDDPKPVITIMLKGED